MTALRLADLETFVATLSKYFVIVEYGVSSLTEWRIMIENPLVEDLTLDINITPFDISDRVNLEYVLQNISESIKTTADSAKIGLIV